MRILQISNFDRKNNLRYFYNTDFKIFNGLIRDGHATYQFSDRDVAKELSPFKSRFGGRKKANQKLLSIFKQLMPDLIIAGHTEIIENETFEQLRKIKPELKIIFFNVDAFFVPEYQRNIDYVKKISKVADFIFSTTAEPNLLKQFSGQRAKISYIPNPFDLAIDSKKAFENNNPDYDLFFAGGWQYRHDILSRIESEISGISIFKCGVTNDTRIFGDEYLSKLSSSRIGLNLSHGEDDKYTPYLYSSDRISQYIGNGLLTFMDAKTGYNDYFSEDEVIFYNSIDDLISKLKIYLKDDEKSRNSAKQAWQKAHKNYSTEKVTKYMIERCFDLDLSEDYNWPTKIY
jgi:glycosyltransferase involved in cell wall biosynthesis